MSRICVKNLPKHATEDSVREFFSQKGEVTDAKVMRTKDGKSRQFGFVGFRTEHEANEALKYFNKSFMNTSRIICEIAWKVGDPNIPRSWSRYSSKKNETSPEEEKKVAGKKGDKSKAEKSSTKKDGDVNHDPQLQEFLQVMEHRSKSKLWANDAVAAPSLGKLPKDTDLEMVEQQEDITSEEDEAVAEANALTDDAAVSDTEYFKSKVRKEWSDSESGDDDDDDDDLSDSKKDAKQSEIEDKFEPNNSETEAEDASLEENGDNNSTNPSSALESEEVLETGRLFIRNLPYTATEEELENYFSKYGAISQVHIVVDRDTKRSKGFSYVLFAVPESAARALEEADSSIFQGRLLHVLPAKSKIIPNKQDNNPTGQNSSKTLKQRKLEEKKASEASGNTRSWNSLFMRPDTVVENIARKLGVSKSDMLDRESTDLAVRIALGETQVVAETKRALSSAGINVASLEAFASGKTDRLKRSNRVILVKNLPYNSSENELSDMFAKFGSLDKIILPPTKTLALVIFLEAAEARAAFHGLHYKRFKDSPLYLEWAPDNILSQSPVTGDTAVDELDAKRALLEQHVEEADVDPDRVESRSLYVKNLNFKTTDEAVKKHFTERVKEGKIQSVRVKKHEKNGKNVSMGYGFIEFDSVDTAVKVCKELQGTVLDGHALILQLCRGKRDKTLPKKAEDEKSLTKLSVKNVAFEATEQDLRQLFSPFGQVKRVRLPRTFGKHRGFAFVEYATKQEAKNALQALSNTHLYGRHLVLGWAKEDENLEELRARTAAQFEDGLVKFSKKRKHMTVLDEGNTKFHRITD